MKDTKSKRGVGEPVDCRGHFDSPDFSEDCNDDFAENFADDGLDDEFNSRDLMMEGAKEFLPKPDELVFKKATRKVTIALDQECIDFFKAEAKRLEVPYQRMIRVLLQEYVARAKQAE